MKLYVRDKDLLKSLFSVLVKTYEDGAAFFLSDRNKITFQISSNFDVPGIDKEKPWVEDSVFGSVIKNIIKDQEILHLDQSIYGVKTEIIGGPIWFDDGSDIEGVWIVVLPRLNNYFKSFNVLAPLLAELQVFRDGLVLYITDKEKVLAKETAGDFDFDDLKVGSFLNEKALPAEVIKTKKPIFQKLPTSVYGIPTSHSCAPILNKETGEVVGALGMVVPLAFINELKNATKRLAGGLAEVSTAMQQIVVSNSEINEMQNLLSGEINNITALSNDINEIMHLIKEIAEEIKMLGINAAIEAARAGTVGRGFGIVADEIRKLSDESKRTVVQIKNLTSKINESIMRTRQSSEQTVSKTKEAAAATEEINAYLEEIAALANELDKITEEL